MGGLLRNCRAVYPTALNREHEVGYFSGPPRGCGTAVCSPGYYYYYYYYSLGESLNRCFKNRSGHSRNWRVIW